MVFHDLVKKLRKRDDELVKEVVRHYGLPPGSKTNLWSIAFWSVIVVAALLLYWVSTKH
jgi:hypothetical protein